MKEYTLIKNNKVNKKNEVKKKKNEVKKKKNEVKKRKNEAEKKIEKKKCITPLSSPEFIYVPSTAEKSERPR
jgi:hypothetical protein